MKTWQEIAQEAMPGIGWDRPQYLALQTEVIRGIQTLAEEIVIARERLGPAGYKIIQEVAEFRKRKAVAAYIKKVK